TTDEASAGGDLNGDGDTSDTAIFELFDLVIGGIVQVPLAIRDRPVVAGIEDWVPLVDEAAQDLDLDGDGDKQDGVYVGTEPPLATQEPTGLSSSGTFASTDDQHDLALVVQEIDGTDRNGDGDLLDSVLVLYDTAGDRKLDSGLALDPNSPLVF